MASRPSQKRARTGHPASLLFLLKTDDCTLITERVILSGGDVFLRRRSRRTSTPASYLHRDRNHFAPGCAADAVSVGGVADFARYSRQRVSNGNALSSPAATACDSNFCASV